MSDKKYTQKFEEWVSEEKIAVNLLNSAGMLMYDKGIEIILFRQNILDVGVTELMRLFSYAQNVVKREIKIKTAALLINEINSLELPPSKLDIGLLTAEFIEEGSNNYKEFLLQKLSEIITKKHNFSPRDVVLFGFGRIGRLAARELIKQAGKGQQMRLKAIVVRKLTDEQIIKRANLLRNDSVHGAFNGVVDIDLENKNIIVNGQIIKLIEGSNPDKINYENYGIKNALLIDNTGALHQKRHFLVILKHKESIKFY